MQVQGQSIAGQGTAELIEKTSTVARVKAVIVIGNQREEKTITVDLTEPLEDRLGDMMKQIGQQLPRMPRSGLVQVSTRRTYCSSEENATSASKLSANAYRQQGQEIEGLIQNWRCLDVLLTESSRDS